MLYCSKSDSVCEHQEPLNVQGGICITQSIKVSPNTSPYMCNQSHGKVPIICTLYTAHYIGLMLHLNLTKTSQLQEQLVRHSPWLYNCTGLKNTLITHRQCWPGRQKRMHKHLWRYNEIDTAIIKHNKIMSVKRRQMCYECMSHRANDDLWLQFKILEIMSHWLL